MAQIRLVEVQAMLCQIEERDRAFRTVLSNPNSEGVSEAFYELEEIKKNFDQHLAELRQQYLSPEEGEKLRAAQAKATRTVCAAQNSFSEHLKSKAGGSNRKFQPKSLTVEEFGQTYVPPSRDTIPIFND